MKRPNPQHSVTLTVTVEPCFYGLDGRPRGHDVWIGGAYVGYRSHDSSTVEEVSTQVAEEVAKLLRERLGWSSEPPPYVRANDGA